MSDNDIYKIKNFQNLLIKWFHNNGRKFPWRKIKISTYQLILTEALLQRTKAETVSKYYFNFFDTYPNWASIYNAGISKLEDSLKPFGLYKQRAKRIWELANDLRTTSWRMPSSYEKLMELPMMGQYITNSYLLIKKGKRVPLLDVNMSRVLERYFGERKLADIRFDPYLQTLSKAVVDHSQSVHVNWAILDYAAMICKSTSPACEDCMFKTNCKYYASQNR